MISGEWGKGDSLLSDSLASPLPPAPRRATLTVGADAVSLAFKAPSNPFGDSEESTLQTAPAEYNRIRHRVVLTVQRLRGQTQKYEGMTAEVMQAEETLIELDTMMQNIESQVREELAGLSGCQEVWFLRLVEWKRDTAVLRSELRTLHAGIASGPSSAGVAVSTASSKQQAGASGGVRLSISSATLGTSRRALLGDAPVGNVGDRLLMMGLMLIVFCVAAVAAPMLRSVMLAAGSVILLLIVCMMQRRRHQRARLMDDSRNDNFTI